ncbi:MAG: response regulator [Bacteroidales bacterium]|nr:response regulator [Bacteroidales bacterium]
MSKDFIHVLLADDDEDDRIFFQDAFKEIKIKTVVETVNDGVELMAYLRKYTSKSPNILFLDLNMPRKSGLECLEEIKLMDHLGEMAIAIYSTSASEEDIEETFVKGANVYIKKPSNFNTLIKILEQVITINWQYQTSGLNRDTYLLSL